MNRIENALTELVKESKRLISQNNIKDWNFGVAVEVGELSLEGPAQSVSPDILQKAEETLRGMNVPQTTGDGTETRTIGEVCTLKFGELTPHIPVMVRGIHQYNNKVKYDLELAVFQEDGWHMTRIYNVDSDYIKPL